MTGRPADGDDRGAGDGEGPRNGESFVHIFPEWCKGCGICVAFCPKNVLEMRCQKASVARPEDCIRCYLCARRCPDFAVGIADERGRVDEKQDKLDRLPAATEADNGKGGAS